MKNELLSNPIPVKIKSGWYYAGKTGNCLGWVFKDQLWAIVVWDDEEDPEMFKLAGLEFLNQNQNFKIENK